MMKTKMLVLCVLIIISVIACSFGIPATGNVIRGSGNVASEERALQGIKGVELAFEGEMTITLGDKESLIIESEDNLLPYIETRVSGGVLTIRNQPNTNLQPTQPIRYTLTVTRLESLMVSSSGNINAPALEESNFKIESKSSGDIHLAGLSATSLAVRISSSGDVSLDSLSADNLDIELSSSGKLEIGEGTVTQQDIDLSSSGTYDGGNVRCQLADVRISSSGNATLWVIEKLDVRLSSSGDVSYYGNPQVNQQLTSSGEVVSLGDK